MLVFLALGNAKVLSFALGDAEVPNANDFCVAVEYRRFGNGYIVATLSIASLLSPASQM